GVTVSAGGDNVALKSFQVNAAAGDGLHVSGVSGLSIDAVNAKLNGAEGLDASALSGANTIANSHFDSNTRGILLAGGSLALTNTTIGGASAANGNAAVNGGGIAVAGGTVNVTNSTIANNAATTNGGGVNVAGGTVNLTNVTISGNTATGTAGGINLT